MSWKFLGMSAIGAWALALALPASAQDCPRVSLLPDAVQLVQLDPASKQGDRIAYLATLKTPQISCIAVAGGVKSAVTFGIEAATGEAKPQPVNIPYLIAIVDGANIVAKQVFMANLNFSTERRRLDQTESVERVTIPLPKGRIAGSYAIMLGFQLSADQVAYNRARAKP